MKRRLRALVSALAVLLVLLTTLTAIPASAARTPASSAGLSINPRKNLVVQPGKSITDTLTIGNLSQTADLQINLRVIDFSFTDQSGTPKLFLADNAPQTAWSLKPFLTLPKDVVVPAGQSRTIRYTVHIPKGQGAGSYYSAIDYTSGSATGGNVNLNASGVTLMFVSVPGIVHEDLSVEKFGAFQTHNNGVSGTFAFINTHEPHWIGYSLKNNGNVAESPTGSVTIYDMWGHKKFTIENVNPNASLALIGQTRLFIACLKSAQTSVNLGGTTTKNQVCAEPHLFPGRYTAKMDLFYGQNGNQTKELTATATFWYLPWWFLAIILAIILLIVYVVFRIRRKLNRGRGGKSSSFKTGRR